MKRLNKMILASQSEPLPQVCDTPQEEAEETVQAQSAFPKIGEWLEKIHIKPFPWKKINAKNALIAGCLVVIAVAGYLNVRYGTQPPSDLTDPDSEQVEGNETEDYFATAIIDRERARGEALEVLMGITEDESADEAAKTNAFTQMERIANETSWEIDIENLVKAKGFQECVAIINEDTANIVVLSDGLTAGEVAQIKEIVYLEAQIKPKDVKIIEKSLVS